MVTDSSVRLVVALTLLLLSYPCYLSPHVVIPPGFYNNNTILPEKNVQAILASYPSLSPHPHPKNHQVLINPSHPLHFHCHSSSSHFHYLLPVPSLSKCLLQLLLCIGHSGEYGRVWYLKILKIPTVWWWDGEIQTRGQLTRLQGQTKQNRTHREVSHIYDSTTKNKI